MSAACTADPEGAAFRNPIRSVFGNYLLLLGSGACILRDLESVEFFRGTVGWFNDTKCAWLSKGVTALFGDF